MWFKNLQVFHLPEPIAYEPEQLAALLQDHQFVPCSKASAQSTGFFSPMGTEDGSLVHAASGMILLCLKTQEKVIPSSVLREELVAKVKEIEANESRNVPYKERARLKDEIHQDLIIRAFCKSSYLFAMIDTQTNRLIVNSASTTKGELFVNTLREALGHLKAQIPEVTSPGMIMTQWLKTQEVSEGFIIEDFCEFRDAEDLGSVRAKQQDITSDTFQAFLQEGCVVKQMRLNWNEQVSLIVKDDFTFSSLKYLDSVLDQRDDSYTETAAERFDADFVIMSQTVRALLEALFEVFAPVSVAA